MKILCIGDVHLRASRPAMRKDDFCETQMCKMLEIGKIFQEENCDFALCTGDLFDRHDPPIGLVNQYMDTFDAYKGDFYVVPGNHDLYGSSMMQIPGTALWNLVKAKKLSLLCPSEPVIKYYGPDNQYVTVWGTSYFDSATVQVDFRKEGDWDSFRILVAHNMILEDKIWAEQPDDSFDYPSDFVKSHPDFNLILCGHYHYKFDTAFGDTDVINPGAVVRIKASKGDMALQPSVVIYDTQTRERTWIPLENARPAEEVFHPKEEVVDQENPELEAFVSAIMHGTLDDGSLDNIVTMVLKQASCSGGVEELVRTKISEATGGSDD